jgi:(p)ppGpp synthase/HD superfamily hydrolase
MKKETSVILSQRFDDALAFASNLHRQQTRKGTNVPYISHLIAVSALVLENSGDEDQAIGGLLHDAAEDQGGQATLDVIAGRFGSSVAQIVSDCTDSWEQPKPEWRQRKEAYLASLANKDPRSLLVSLADKTHNAGSIVTDLNYVGAEVWERFAGKRTGTLWYYRALAEIFDQAMQGPLANQLMAHVEAMTAQRDD